MASGLASVLWTLPASASVLINVDKSTQQMTVKVDGALKWQWKVSTGRTGHDTPGGNFKANSMETMHYSKKYDNAPMPHSIFFTNDGHAIHGTLDARHLGLPASHGCVRLDQANATQLFTLVKQEGLANTTVVISGDAALAKRNAPAPQTVATVAPLYPQRSAPQTIASPTTTSVAQTYVSPSPRPSSAPTSRDDSYRVSVTQPSAPPVAPPGYPPFPRAWQ
jgi:L,D-transpeptidase-like protein